jgi:hypothetical protein
MANDANIPAAEMVAKFVAGWPGPGRSDIIHGDQVGTQKEAFLTHSDLLELLAERQHWINVAAGMGNHVARALATEGWEKP